MLKKLYIHNFKSFWRSNFEFGKMNCIIAPNNAGKSNLIEAIELLDNILFRPDENKINLYGMQNFRYKEENIVLNAEFELSNRVLVLNDLIDFKCTIKFYITIGNVNNIDMTIDGYTKFIDILDKDRKFDVNWYFMSKMYNEELINSIINYEEYAKRLDKKRYAKFSFSYSQSTLNYNITTNKSAYDTVVNMLGLHMDSKKSLTKPIEFKNIFTRYSIFESYYFHAHSIKENQVTSKNSKLNKDGTNLVEFISKLEDNKVEEISMSLIGEVEQVNGIKVSQEAQKRLYFLENEYPVVLKDTSDGTVHFLSIMSALIGNNYSMAVMIEEPERHMHMRVLSTILYTMRDDDKQIFFTTHSTEILQQLELDEILFMFRDYDGDTKGQKAKNIPNIKKIMDIYKDDIVEMIQTGILGEYDE